MVSIKLVLGIIGLIVLVLYVLYNIGLKGINKFVYEIVEILRNREKSIESNIVEAKTLCRNTSGLIPSVLYQALDMVSYRLREE